ncbi:DgyrCDS3376 [Dimorphilus gyrociliatus]|uniref:Glutamyl-tRNA(Gln) amidotransferase subunit C, mitochondrial n=1 Tax=Dimorphilus gyrociliatus TaxID=2664684 RepID=A0A7I8VDL1_9ANNE|nr:DgyrCDS3376 [Dimorphilus gyrociliatus]
MSIFHDEVEIEDFEYDEESETYYYPCPCGDKFEITKEQLENGEEEAGCPSCSLIVKVIYNPEDFMKGEEVRLPSKKMLRLARSCYRCFSSKVPQQPTWKVIDDSKLPPKTKIDKKTIQYLERLSLVQLGDEDGVRRLEDSISLADRLSIVNTEDIKPLSNILEEESLFLRKDYVTEGDSKDSLLQMAAATENDYYVAPPGNIPVKLDSVCK